jgi:hypothetical protein
MESMLRLFATITVALFFITSCARGPTPEQRRQIEVLQAELDEVKKEIASAKIAEVKYEGGLLKSLILVRVEVLKTTEALIQQRIKGIEGKTPVAIQTLASKPDAVRAEALAGEIKLQEEKLHQAEAEASRYSGGLIQALALTATATQAQTLAMLRQQYILAKFGLAIPQNAIATNARTENAGKNFPAPIRERSTDKRLEDQIIQVSLLRKEFAKQDYQEYIFFNLDFTATGLDKPARAIKGTLIFTDLFGEAKFKLGWTIDKPIKPAEVTSEKGSGFKYNQFVDSHQWVKTTQIEDLKISFTVRNILYQDGTRRDFD